MQEQHADLLSLLAQQEVELSVVRSALESRIGPQGMLVVETDARDQVTTLYGSYIDFRQPVVTSSESSTELAKYSANRAE